MNKYIQIADLNAQYLELKKEIDSAIEKTIQTSMFIRGEEVEVFEDEYAKLHGVKHCISCGNGTDALYITLKGLNISEGDEVITTSHSWISTSEAISQAGGVPIFCDTDTETYCIDATKIRNLITERTVGILPVHLYGHPAEMKKIKEIADEFKLWVVEDCAQAHIAEYENKKVGTFGIASTFSFYPGKNLGAFGDAGCILTNDDNLAEWCRLYSRHGGKGKHYIEGINSRMDTIQAAILNVKLKYINVWTEQRIEKAKYYDIGLKGVGEVKCPTTKKHVKHVFHLYTLRTDQRDDLREHLSINRIQTSINYPICLPLLPAYKRLQYTKEEFPNASRTQSEIISIPMYPQLSMNDQDKIIDSIKEFFG